MSKSLRSNRIADGALKYPQVSVLAFLGRGPSRWM